MGSRSPVVYRGDERGAEGLPPRKLVWKWHLRGPGGLFAWLFTGFGAFIALVFTACGVPSVIAVHAFGETRDAEIVGVVLHEPPASGKRRYEIRFRHELGGRAHEGERVVYPDGSGIWPPGIPVEVGEQTTVSCFSHLGFHGDDLALPREVAFHRRASEIATWSFAALAAWAWVLVVWALGIRPVQRERTILRDGVRVSGRVTGLETLQRGRKKTPLLRVSYSFDPLQGPPRRGACEARDQAAFARLAVGDVVQVLYDPSSPSESVAYEVGAYDFVPPPRELATLEPKPR